MKRLCFLSPDLEHARNVVADLKQDGVAEKNIYALARSDLDMTGLPDGGPDDDDFLPAFERGIGFGGVAGMFAGLLAMAFPPAGVIVAGGGVLLTTVAGASMGAILSGIAGASYPNSRLKAFEENIKAGKILIMVDVPVEKVASTNALIQRFDPAVLVEGVEPHAPVIPR